jgi:hypothetical protein
MGHRTIRRRGEINVQADELRRRIEMLERRHYDEAKFIVLERKLFADANMLDGNLPPAVTDVVTGTGKYVFSIDVELDEWYLVMAQAFVSTVGGGDTTVQVVNLTAGGVNMLVDGVTIPSGEFTSSCDLDELAEIDFANDQVAGCDMLSLDVIAAGAGAQGLGVYLTLSDTPLDAS